MTKPRARRAKAAAKNQIQDAKEKSPDGPQNSKEQTEGQPVDHKNSRYRKL